MTRLKICGITSVDDAELCLSAGADALGLNLVPSSRRAIDADTARAIARAAGGRAEIVLVVADRPEGELRALLEHVGATRLQLHGTEPAELVSRLLPHAMKAVRIGSAADAAHALEFPGEHLLVDACAPGELGGTGRTFDWTLAAPLAKARKLWLAGGLTPDNVARAIAEVHPFAVDVASGVESGEPRRKDPGKVRAFVQAARGAG